MNNTATTAPANGQKQFEALLETNLRVAYSMAFRLTHNAEDAEDLLQEASIQAYRAFGSFQAGTHFRAWFLKILTNLFLNKYRKSLRQPEIADIEDVTELYLYTKAKRAGVEGKGADPAALIMSKLDTGQIEAAIDSLPQEYRLVASLYFIDEFTYPDIAEILDCPIGTVRSRLHRGRKMLQKQLWELAEPYLQDGKKKKGAKSAEGCNL